MADVFSKAERSRIMARIRSKDTAPELAVRTALRGIGHRYKLHSARLPGHPDLVLTAAKIAVFVHGCFWHQHRGCKRRSMPSTRRGYWIPKLARNIARFRDVRRELISKGWKVIVIWECETKSEERLLRILQKKIPLPK